MATNTEPAVPRGWYPDPLGLPQQRWWNGELWTSDVAPLAAPLTAPDAAAPSDPGSASWTGNSVPYRPFGMSPKVSPGSAAPPGRVYTLSAWILATLPILVGALAALIATELAPYYSLFMASGLALVLLLLSILLASNDRSELLAAGFHRPPSPGWIVLTPLAYFAVRSLVAKREADRRALGPLVVWILLVAALAVAAVLLPTWTAVLINIPILLG